MTRLIDADEELNKLSEMVVGGETFTTAVEFAKLTLCNAPTVDAEPVIRCKDCALWDDADSDHLVGYCTEGDGEKITFRNEWCCWAERKEE